jgi:hypothetical protein
VEPIWDSERKLERHFRDHGRALGCSDVASYDRSALETVDVGIPFRYVDRGSSEERLGYYEPISERFTAINPDNMTIVSHFRCDERYILRLWEQDYR